MRCHYIFVNILFLYIIFRVRTTQIIDYLRLVDFTYFSTCALLGNILHKRLYTFYDELNTFDFIFKYKKQITNKYLFIYLFTLFLLVSFIFVTRHFALEKYCLNDLYILSVVIFNILELHYHGHMFSLITPRLKFITKYIELLTPKSRSYGFVDTNSSNRHNPKNKTNLNPIITIQNVTNMYNKIIYIHDCIVGAIKWQVCIPSIIIGIMKKKSWFQVP